MLTYVHSKVTRKKVDSVEIFNRAAMTGFLGKPTKSVWKNDRKHGSVAMTLFQIIRSLKIFRIHQLKKKKVILRKSASASEWMPSLSQLQGGQCSKKETPPASCFSHG